jgi:GNAT superfamily N-acetyltransferase
MVVVLHALLFVFFLVNNSRVSQTGRTNCSLMNHEPSAATRISKQTMPKVNEIKWIIRPATMEDKEKATKLLRASYENLLANDYEPDILKEALPIIARAQPSLLTSGTWYIVLHPETRDMVGCGGWTPESPMKDQQGRHYPHLRHFATHPNWLRRGVARVIWNQIWQDVVNMTGPDTVLELFSTITAQPFYESLGFEAVESFMIPLTASCQFPSVIMRRQPS